MPTFALVETMSDDEVKELNKRLTRQLGTQLLLTVVVGTAAHFAADFVMRKYFDA